MSDPQTTADLPAGGDARRALLHPLKNASIGESAGTGEWVRLNTPGELENVHFPEDNPSLGAGVSSVPTPWARLELFRDAVRDAPQSRQATDAHPFSGDAIQDILDALELLLFEGHMDGVTLQRHVLDLGALATLARREHEDGIGRFLTAVRDQAPREEDGQLDRITIVTDGRRRLLFATSPYTLFFTPEDQTAAIPGYFGARERPRPLAARPPELAGFVAGRLLPLLERHTSRHPELQRLVAVLQRQLQEVPDGRRAFSLENLDETSALQPIPGVPVGRLRALTWTGRGSLKASRGSARPLVLNDQVLESEREYFPWLTPSQGTRVLEAEDRGRLPGTAWRQPWVDPGRDFLVDNLLILERAELDLGSVLGREIYEGMSSQVEWRRPGQILLPLSARYFEHFSPEDAVRQLRMTMDPEGMRIEARLTLPVEGGERTFTRVYTRGENVATAEFYLSVWPDFVPETPQAFEWSVYSVFHLAFGRGADEFDLRVGMGDAEVAVAGAYGNPPLRRFVRDQNAAFYALDQAPGYLRVRLRRHPGSEEFIGEGVVLPKLELRARPAAAPWTVAVDLGTSNTSVAVRKGPETPVELLSLTGRASATRRDLMRAPAVVGGAGRADALRIADTFFYPDSLPDAPFPTHIERTTKALDRENEELFRIPAATANIPFRGDLAHGQLNRLEGDLKWGGGLAMVEHNLLTEQFLKQLLVLIYAEAVRSGARVDDLTLRWSYPSAFTTEESEQFIQRWRNVLRWFADQRLGSIPLAEGQDGGARKAILRVIEEADRLPDESTSALWYFKQLREFTVHDEALAIAVDLGGGTTDIASYANGHGQFRNSILLGGRDLVGALPDDDGRPGVNPFYRYLERWVLERIGRESSQLLTDITTALNEYATSHGKFGYLVRHPWFQEHRTELMEEPWFRSAQAVIVYLFGAVFFHLGVLVRADRAAGGQYEPPSRVMFGGNGSRYLEWLSGFRRFAGSRPAQEFFIPLFRDLFEASLEADLGARFEVIVSPAPKQEVALGLLSTEAGHLLRGADGQTHGTRAATDDAPGSIRKHHPVGEFSRFPGHSQGIRPEQEVTVSGPSGTLFSYAATADAASSPPPEGGRAADEFEGSMIRRFHTTLLEALGRPDAPHREWPGVRDRMAAILRECDRSFYIPRVREELERRLWGDARLTPSVFAIEVAATLRHLQEALFPEPQDGRR
ncbi:MAG TPA: hypothetical protein VFJ82_20940 [Longimicrobium sp.]|nr:hypothetical protein [Longimicrobium sp.]